MKPAKIALIAALTEAAKTRLGQARPQAKKQGAFAPFAALLEALLASSAGSKAQPAKGRAWPTSFVATRNALPKGRNEQPAASASTQSSKAPFVPHGRRLERAAPKAGAVPGQGPGRWARHTAEAQPQAVQPEALAPAPAASAKEASRGLRATDSARFSGKAHQQRGSQPQKTKPDAAEAQLGASVALPVTAAVEAKAMSKADASAPLRVPASRTAPLQPKAPATVQAPVALAASAQETPRAWRAFSAQRSEPQAHGQALMASRQKGSASEPAPVPQHAGHDRKNRLVEHRSAPLQLPEQTHGKEALSERAAAQLAPASKVEPEMRAKAAALQHARPTKASAHAPSAFPRRAAVIEKRIAPAPLPARSEGAPTQQAGAPSASYALPQPTPRSEAPSAPIQTDPGPSEGPIAATTLPGDAASGPSAASTPQSEPAPRAWTPQQALLQLAAWAKAGRHSVMLQLDPPHLGHVQARISVDHERKVHIWVALQEAHARPLLEAQLPALREALASQGMQLGSFAFDGGQGQGSARQSPMPRPASAPLAEEKANASALELRPSVRRGVDLRI